MKNRLTGFRSLIFTLVIVLTFSALAAQHDSLTIVQKINAANIILYRNFPEGFAACREAEILTRSSSCKNCRQQALYLLGKAYWINGEYNQAVALLKQGIGIQAQPADSALLADAVNKIGLNFYYQAYYDTAIIYFQRSLDIYSRLNDKPGMARLLSNISLMYHRKGDYAKTVEYLLKGEELNDKLADDSRSLGDFPGMENVFPDSLYFREEIQDNLRLLNINLQKGNVQAAHTNYANLAVAYSQLKDYRNAARYYMKVCDSQQKSGLRPYWNEVAVNYRQVNMKDSCFFYHRKSREHFPRATRLEILAAYEAAGDSHFHFEQYDSALKDYQIALAMNTACNNRLTMAGLHAKLTDVYRKLGRSGDANYHVTRGLPLAREVSVKHYRSLLKTAADLFAETGDYRTSHILQKQYAQLLDSVSRAETALTLTGMLARYKTAKKERELASLKIEKERNDLVLKNRNITLASLAGITLFSFVFMFVFASQRNRIKKKNHALDLAYREQDVLIKEIHHRVKNNLQIINSLINLKASRASSETNDILRQISARIYSMGLIHEKLYQKDEFRQIPLDSYLIELGKHILASLPGTNTPIDFSFECDPVQTDVDRALTCGLILNELVTNSLKHAFKDQARQEVRLVLKKSASGILLQISDNGTSEVSLPPASETTFGLRFIDHLVRSKLNGIWSAGHNKGFHADITFPYIAES